MQILIAYGSKRGGTAGLAQMLDAELERMGFEVTVQEASEVEDLSRFDAVIVGGALYMERWHKSARRFVKRFFDPLCARKVWFFSSGPLDDSAAKTEIPPIPKVKRWMDQIGVIGHKTFGGRLEKDAKGWIAQMMAKEHSGDWRDPGQVHLWAQEIAQTLHKANQPIPIVLSLKESPAQL